MCLINYLEFERFVSQTGQQSVLNFVAQHRFFVTFLFQKKNRGVRVGSGFNAQCISTIFAKLGGPLLCLCVCVSISFLLFAHPI